jgi:signal transduction histidine kinase
VLFLWPQAHVFTDDERYLFTSLAHTASIVVDRLRLYREALAQAESLRELDRLKTEFLYTMSHEFRTPLNTIIGLSSLILDGAEGEMSREIQRDVELINADGRHLSAMITDILDMAKIESGSLALHLENLAADELITEVVRSILPTAEEKGLRITVELPPDPPRLKADPLRVRQILLNLLSNAVKFSERGTIQVSATREGDHLIICVRDEGLGICPEHLAIIFEPFRQVDGTLSRVQGGVGLGLAITRRLVEQHGGRIRVTSAPGEGSAFYVSLPVTEESDENPVH